MLVNPYLRQLHPYYYDRLREAPFNAVVIFVCGAFAMLIILAAAFIG